jgi:hypothetical protein
MSHNTPAKGNGPEHEDPTSPAAVFRDALTSIIFLLGTFVAEFIKHKIPGGVPFTVSLILTISEVTLGVYFVVLLVRAIGYALRAIDEEVESVRQNRLWRSLLDFIQRRKPATRAIRFIRRVLKYVAYVAVIFILISLIEVRMYVMDPSYEGPLPKVFVPSKFALLLYDYRLIILTSVVVGIYVVSLVTLLLRRRKYLR